MNQARWHLFQPLGPVKLNWSVVKGWSYFGSEGWTPYELYLIGCDQLGQLFVTGRVGQTNFVSRLCFEDWTSVQWEIHSKHTIEGFDPGSE